MNKASRIANVALALGAFTSIFTPTASAATQPDLVTGTLYFKDIDVAETVTLPVMVRNRGDKFAVGTELYINLGPGLALLEPVSEPGWRCTAPIRSNSDGSTSTTCTSWSSIEAGQFKSIGVKVHGEPGQEANQFYLALRVDPDSKIPESDEDNNVTIEHF
jgi:hypothetical protein